MGADKDGWTFAPDDIQKAHLTQAWLAAGEDELALSTGEYFYHQSIRAPNGIANDVGAQEQLLGQCGRISGVAFPN